MTAAELQAQLDDISERIDMLTRDLSALRADYAGISAAIASLQESRRATESRLGLVESATPPPMAYVPEREASEPASVTYDLSVDKWIFPGEEEQ